MVDIDDEIVCSSCGSVRPKEVGASSVGGATARRARAVDYTNHSLGSFLGPMEHDRDEAPFRVEHRAGVALANLRRQPQHRCPRAVRLPRDAVDDDTVGPHTARGGTMR